MVRILNGASTLLNVIIGADEDMLAAYEKALFKFLVAPVAPVTSVVPEGRGFYNHFNVHLHLYLHLLCRNPYIYLGGLIFTLTFCTTFCPLHLHFLCPQSLHFLPLGNMVSSL